MLPVILAFKPITHKRSNGVPTGKGSYKLITNRVDSELEFYVNDKSVPVQDNRLELTEFSLFSVLFIRAGTEKSIDLFLERT